MLSNVVRLPRAYKIAIMVFGDLLLIPSACWLSFNLRLDFQYAWPAGFDAAAILLTTVLTVLVFVRIGLYRAILRHIGIEAAWVLTKGAAISALILVCTCLLIGNFLPRSVPIIYFLLLLVAVGSTRFLLRHLLYKLEKKPTLNVAIYGAGSSGAQVFSALFSSRECCPVFFVDDDPALQGRTLRGVPVIERNALPGMLRRFDVKELLLAIPAASPTNRKNILDFVAPMPVHVRTIPSIDDLVSGTAKIEEFQEVAIEDLLGRDSVAPDQSLLNANIAGKVAMVTGAGGSIGSELCRQIVAIGPKTLVLFEQCEYALYKIQKELCDTLGNASGVEPTIYPILGSVLDEAKLDSVLVSFGVNTIYHAAAYKHVPLVEYNVVAGIRNNVFGTLNLAKQAMKHKVASCVLISTDKAVRPTNVMGASKRLAELIFQGMDDEESTTCFSMVRFGNVLGSSGSVIPLFREQIAAGGPITVTHPDIIRYFMTIPEASQLVIQAGAMAKGGDVFVLDMGEPVRIDDLAKKMVHLMGLNLKQSQEDEGDIAIEYTGLRPGEKLYEELLIGDNALVTQHPRIRQAKEFSLDWGDLSRLLQKMETLCTRGECDEICRMLQLDCPIDFDHKGAVEDILWNHRCTDEAELEEEVSVSQMGELVSIDSRQNLAS